MAKYSRNSKGNNFNIPEKTRENCPPKKMGAEASACLCGFAPTIEEENGSTTNKHGSNFLPGLCPKSFIYTTSHLDLLASPHVKNMLSIHFTSFAGNMKVQQGCSWVANFPDSFTCTIVIEYDISISGPLVSLKRLVAPLTQLTTIMCTGVLKTQALHGNITLIRTIYTCLLEKASISNAFLSHVKRWVAHPPECLACFHSNLKVSLSRHAWITEANLPAQQNWTRMAMP